MIEYTKEMYDYYYKRQWKHTDLVKSIGLKLINIPEFIDRYSNISGLSEFDRILTVHDLDKLQHVNVNDFKTNKKFIHGFIHLCEQYRRKRLNLDEYVLDDDIKELCHYGTVLHVLCNTHHPEYWDPTINKTSDDRFNIINVENRDEPSIRKILAYKMPEISLCEMVCDWCAVSIERNDSLIKWAINNINRRWMFNNYQVKFIYDIVKMCEEIKNEL